MRPTATTIARRVTSSPVVWGGVMTALRGVGFLLVMAYALRRIPTQEIGAWYVMLTIAGLGGIVEFGFAATLGRYTSYYSGGATGIPALGTKGAASNAVNVPAIVSLARMARGLYAVFGLLVGVLMLVAWVA